jgi:hypothetical protein
MQINYISYIILFLLQSKIRVRIIPPTPKNSTNDPTNPILHHTTYNLKFKQNHTVAPLLNFRSQRHACLSSGSVSWFVEINLINDGVPFRKK